MEGDVEPVAAKKASKKLSRNMSTPSKLKAPAPLDISRVNNFTVETSLLPRSRTSLVPGNEVASVPWFACHLSVQWSMQITVYIHHIHQVLLCALNS